MRPLLIACSVVLSSILFINLTLADTCSDYRKRTGLDLNEAECYVLEQVEKGKLAHFRESQEWPYGNYLSNFTKIEDRIISANFLSKLLRGQLSELTVTEEGVQIWGALVSKALNLQGATIPFSIHFSDCTFQKEVDFNMTLFTKSASFGNTQFSKAAGFSLAQFSETISFDEAQFLGYAGFSGVQFLGDSSFSNSEFRAKADFNGSKFSSYANFIRTHFFSEASFRETKFLARTHFMGTQFSDETVFDQVKFFKTANFLRSKFQGSSSFQGCYYHNHIYFGDVTGFSNMQMEWEYDPEKFRAEKEEDNAKLRGLKNHIYYNETFYIALIKNYRDMGWFKEADDCYYTYRVERRKHRLQKLYKQNENIVKNLISFSRLWEKAKLCGEWLLLDLTFGYGMKPKKIFLTFVVFWVLFIPIYLVLLQHQWIRKQVWFKELHRRLYRAILFSLDTLLPRVNLRSESTLSPYAFSQVGFKKQLLNFCIRVQEILGWYWFALFLILFSRVWIR